MTRPVPAEQLPAWRRRPVPVIVACVALLGVPRLLAGPSLMADDWVWVRNGEFLAWWDAGGSRQAGRPGAYGLYSLMFGVGGARPLVHAVVQLVLWAAAGAVVHAALRRVVDARAALACTLAWLVAPSHLTLELWASTSQAWVAVIALAGGLWCLCDDRAAMRRAGWVLLVASGAFYEVAIPAVPIVAIVADRARGGRWHRRSLVTGAVAAVPAAVWALVTASIYDAGVRTTEDRWLQHVAGSLGMGVRVDDESVAALVLVAALAAGALLVRRRSRGASTPEEGWALIGLGLAVAASIPGLRSYTIPVGMGDRLTAVSGIGAAVFWYGAWRVGTARATSRIRVAVVAALVLAALLTRADAVTEWVDLEDDVLAVVRPLRDDVTAAGGRLVVEGPLVDGDAFYGLYDGWNATAAVQVTAGDPTAVVQVDVRCARTGPSFDEPLEQDGQRAAFTVPECRGG